MSMGPLYVSLGEGSVQGLCPFFNWIINFSSWSRVMRILYIFWRSGPSLRYHWQICFPILLVLLYFHAVFFSHTEAFYFDEGPLVILSFMSLALGDVSVRMLLRGMSQIFLPMFSSRTFMVLQLIFKYCIHFEFIFVYGVS